MWTRFNRLRRRLGFDRSDLRRRIDRVQWALGLGLLVLFVVVATPLGTWIGMLTYGSGVHQEHRQAAARHSVTATVIGGAGVGSSGGHGYLHQTVRATWPDPSTPNGPPRTGVIPAWKGATPGATRHIWVTGSGEPTVKPRPHSRTVADTAYITSATVLATGLPVLLVYWGVRFQCDRQRDKMWDADWARLDTPRIG